MVDRGFEVSRQKPQAAANVPAAREARVERKCAIDQRHHRADVLSDERQRIGSIRQTIAFPLRTKQEKSSGIRACYRDHTAGH